MSVSTAVKGSNNLASLGSFPDLQLDWSHDDPSHPGFGMSGLDNTPGNKAYFIHLEAKPGKEELLKKFLQDINDGVDKEALTDPGSA
jgi:hypothetical protein